MRLFVSLFLCSVSLWAQYPVTASRIVNGTTVPSKCVAGQVFVKTNATPAQQQYICNVSTGLFVLQGAAGGGTIPSTTDLLSGDGAGNAADSTIVPANVVQLTATQTLTNKTVDGVTPTTMGYVDATSSIQTQLNSKSAHHAVYVGTPQINVTSTSALYCPITGGSECSTTESTQTTGAPETATYSSLCVTTRATQPSTAATTFTFRVAGANTALVATIAINSAAGVYCDTTHTVSVTMGQLVDIAGQNGTSETSAIVNATSLITN